jgi:hypothetical protein
VPAPRLLILGPRGSGKSAQARPLAQKLDVFHIKFRDRLQELIIGKVKKPVGPEYEEDKSDDEDTDTRFSLSFYLITFSHAPCLYNRSQSRTRTKTGFLSKFTV